MSIVAFLIPNRTCPSPSSTSSWQRIARTRISSISREVRALLSSGARTQRDLRSTPSPTHTWLAKVLRMNLFQFAESLSCFLAKNHRVEGCNEFDHSRLRLRCLGLVDDDVARTHTGLGVDRTCRMPRIAQS